MIKSNSREARRAIEASVIEWIDIVNDRMGYENLLRPVSAAFETLKDEMKYQSDENNGYPVVGVGLAEKYRKAGKLGYYVPAVSPYWVWYLACKAGEFDVCYSDQRACIAEWLQETPEESERYSNDEVLQHYCYLTSKAFERLYERENTPHKVKTSEFVSLYHKHNGGKFFDRKTLKFFGQTMRSFSVYAFELVTDYKGNTHDCYSVYHTITSPDGQQFPKVAYFDRLTFDQVFPIDC